MSNANVVKNDNTAINWIPLSAQERRRLSSIVLGYGKMKQVSIAVGIPTNTIRRAISGMNLRPDTATKIRTYLNSL